jgi:hypothetical protein
VTHIIHEDLLLNLLRDSMFNVRPTEQGSGTATNCARHRLAAGRRHPEQVAMQREGLPRAGRLRLPVER